MTEKLYNLGIIVGRFQTLHKGHVEMLRTALSLCNEVGIFIGSSQESGTAANPFTYEMRKSFITNVFSDSVKIYPLPDIGVGNTSKWGEYVLKNASERFGRMPDLFVSGKESRRQDWLSSELGANIAELYVPKTVEISASEMRKFLINDEKEAFLRYIPKENSCLYDTLREIVLESKDNHFTRSI